MDSFHKKQVFIIAGMVCKKYGIERINLQSKTRKHEVVVARQIIWSIAREIYGSQASQYGLGRLIGDKDHATVLTGCKRVQNYIETERAFRAEYFGLLHKARELTSLGPSEIRGKADDSLADILTEILKCKEPINMRIGIRQIIANLKVA